MLRVGLWGRWQCGGKYRVFEGQNMSRVTGRRYIVGVRVEVGEGGRKGCPLTQMVKETNTYKYLGILLDSQLKWKEQASRVTANATTWIMQYRRLTKPSTGVKPKLMRQLYISISLPKITYSLDTWYTPPSKQEGHHKNIGSITALCNLQKTQCIATLAITGMLRTSPNDLVNIHTNLFPIDLALLSPATMP